MQLVSHLRTTCIKNKGLIISFIISVLCYIVYVLFRGFGWDGDSFISASQYQKLIGSDLYGIIDWGTHPKILTVIFFGLIYQITNGFYLLTCISIILNALMIGTIIKWVDREKGFWIIALIGLLINIPWTKIVVNCDNPAFSIPFVIFGLYYISKNKIIKGATLLTVSSLFRSGAEFIILIILLTQLFNKNLRNTIILGFALAISAIHTYWGYLLIYPTKELFWELVWKYLTTSESIDKYQYSLTAFIPYLSSIINQLFNKYSILFIIPSIIGIVTIIRKQNSIRFILLIPLASLILPLGSFIYGIAHPELESKHMGFTILLPVLAAFSINSSILDKVGSKAKVFIAGGILLIIILFSAFTGNLKQGDYGAHINGTGRIGWSNFPDIKHDIKSIFPSEKINILTAYHYLTFVTADIGKYAYNIDVIREVTEIDSDKLNSYNLIVIPKKWDFNVNELSTKGFSVKVNLQSQYIYLIRNDINN
jgi:hypothetical protein